MDVVQDWTTYLLSPSNPLRPYFFQFLSYTHHLQTYTTPLLNALTQKPDLATLALLLLILFLSLKILNMLVNTVMFWVRLFCRVAFWGGLALVGFWMWTRGPEGVVTDAQMWAGRWAQEYRYFSEQQQEAARMARGRQQPYGGGF